VKTGARNGGKNSLATPIVLQIGTSTPTRTSLQSLKEFWLWEGISTALSWIKCIRKEGCFIAHFRHNCHCDNVLCHLMHVAILC